MSNPPRPRPALRHITPYIPGRQRTAKAITTYRMASNENPLGASPEAQRILTQGDINPALYPEGSSLALRLALAQRFHLPEAAIVCGAGSDELLTLLALAYLSEGDEAIYCRHGFLVYPNAIRLAGATPVIAEAENLEVSAQAILRAVTNRTKMIFLANPNNPTGTYFSNEALIKLHKALPENILLVVDAAYAEYVSANDYHSGLDLVTQHANVVMTRTFSKIYGLAGLRVGWMYAPEAIAGVIHAIRGPFNLSSLAQATAIAALNDQDFLKRSIAHNNRWRAWLAEALKKLDIPTTPSEGNFLLAHFPGQKGEVATHVANDLEDAGVLVRGMTAYDLPNALRFSIGCEAGNRQLIKTLTHFKKQMGN